jgi:hypothetical protein
LWGEASETGASRLDRLAPVDLAKKHLNASFRSSQANGKTCRIQRAAAPKGDGNPPLELTGRYCLIPMLPTGPAFSNDIISKLGEPRRNVTTRARSVDEVSHQLARTYPGVTGVIPLMIFPSNSLVVENAFKALASPTTCRSILADYDRRLRAQHGDKIRHGLYCVSVADGKLKSIDTIAKSF